MNIPQIFKIGIKVPKFLKKIAMVTVVTIIATIIIVRAITPLSRYDSPYEFVYYGLYWKHIFPILHIYQPPQTYPWKSGETIVTLSKDGTLRVRKSIWGKLGRPIARLWHKLEIKSGGMEDYDLPSRNTDAPYDPFKSYPQWISVIDSITNLVIESGVTHIGQGAFYMHRRLTSVTIPNSVKTIGMSAFEGCDNLTSIFIPNSVTDIGTFAFNSVIAIDVAVDNPIYSSVDGVLFNKEKNILIQYPRNKKDTAYTIPKSVQKIERFAFRDCNNLMSITIPNSVAYIDAVAFIRNTNLTSINILNPIPFECPLDEYDFNKRNACLYVPESSIVAYRAAHYWQDIVCIKPLPIKEME